MEICRPDSKLTIRSYIKNETVYQAFSLRLVNADFELKIANDTLQKRSRTTYLDAVMDNELNFIHHVNTFTSILKRQAGDIRGLK